MVRWIRLGHELEHRAHQLPRVLLSRECKDLGVDGNDVQRRSIRISKPELMVNTEIADCNWAVIVGPEYYSMKLKRDRDLANALRPEAKSQWTTIREEIVDQINLYLQKLRPPTAQTDIEAA